MTVTVDVNAPEVFTITCEETSHEDRPYLVAVLSPSFYGPNGVPFEDLEEPVDPSTLSCLWWPARALRTGERGPRVKLKRSKATRRALTDADELYDPHDAEVDRSLVRARFSLKCRLCGLSLSARAEKLDPVITTLVAHGINAVTLRGLIDSYHRAPRNEKR